MDLEKIIKKDASKEEESNTNKIPINLKDKRIIIGGGIIGGLFLVILLGKMFSGGETVQVQQGVGTKEVKTIVEETTKPLAEKLQEQEEINKQLLDMLKKQQGGTDQKTEGKKEEKKEEPSPLSALFPSPTPPQPQPQPLPAPTPTPTPTASLTPLPSPPMPGSEEKNEPPKPRLNHKSLAIEREGKLVIPEVNEGNGKSASPSGDGMPPVYSTDENGMPVLNKNVANASGSDNPDNNVKKKKTVYIPAGSMTYGTLLYSFTAPSDGMFPPVIIEIEKPAITANHWKVPVEKCFVLAKAQYDISTERAILGGNDSIISCVLKNGKVIEKKVNIAVGEEINGNVEMGLSGTEKWLTGEDFAKIATLAAAQGMSAGLQQALMQQSMTAYGSVMSSIKNRGEYAILGGINNAFNRFYDFWMKKYDKKVPAIEVSAPRPVFITFVNGIDLDVSDKDLKF